VHHLLSPECGTWYKQFGVSRWNHYGALLRALVFESFSLEAYKATRSKILTMTDYCGEPQSFINYFNQVIHVARKQFARYSVRATPCNEQCLGSSIAEANHSSYVGRIGGGSRDDPATQVKDCILRMQELSNKRASFRDKYRRQVAASSHTTCNKTIALMLIKLSKRGFKICEEQYKKSSEYDCCSLLIDGTEQKARTARVMCSLRTRFNVDISSHFTKVNSSFSLSIPSSMPSHFRHHPQIQITPLSCQHGV
jgi:hypothetical protein